MEYARTQKILTNAAETTHGIEGQDGIRMARTQFLDELPGLAFAILTLVWIVASLTQLGW